MNSTIDNLNFAVIIDDTEFNKQIKKMEEDAKKFNTSMSNLLNLKKQAQQWSQKDVENNRRAWQAKVDEGRAQEKINREKAKTEGLQRKINSQIDQANNKYKTQSRIISEIKTAVLGYLSVQGAGRLLASLVKVTGEFELQKTTLAAMLGDLNAAEQIITRIQGLAVESPFQFKELTTYAKQLSAFSVPTQELYDTTKMLADISAGLGVGMDRIVLAYGQVRSAAFLRGQEVRQFTEAGIPILNELAKQFSELEGRVVSTTEVFDKISSRLVPFEMVAKVFKDMTSEGGKFYNMQEIQAETLRGKLSNLKDAYEVMLNEIGQGQSENLKGAVDWVRRLMQNYEETGRSLIELVAAYGAYKTALIAITAMTGTFNLANHKLLSTLVKVGSWVSKNPYVLLAAGLTAVGYSIYQSATHLESYEKVQKSVADTQSKFTKSVLSETSKLNTLYAKLELAKEGTEEYNEAKKAIYSQYASYISDLQNEGVAVDNLASIYEKLKIKIEESQQARFRTIALQDLDQTYKEQTESILDEAENATERLLKKVKFNLNTLQKEAVQAYVAGTLSMEDLESDERLKGVATILKNAADSGNRAWMQFGTSIENAREQFLKSTAAYEEGLNAIDSIYGKAQDTATSGLNPFVYGLEEGDNSAQKAIEEQIRSIQKLQDAYNKLLPYLDEVQMKSTLKSLFPNIKESIIDSLDFTSELERLAKELEAFDKDAAQRLRDTIGKDVAGEIAESFKAMEQYKKMMDSWFGEDFDIVGEGTAFDISKIIRNLNSEYAKIDEKRLKALDMLKKAQLGDEQALAKVREVYGEEVWQKYLENGTEAINELATKEMNAARLVANEKIRDLASKDLKERMEKQNINLGDYEDKTLAQIKELINRLYSLRAQIRAELELIKADGVTVEEEANVQRLEAEIEQLGTVITDTGEELDKKLFDNVKAGMETISELGSSIESLGEAVGASGIAEFGKNLNNVASTASKLADALKAEDTVAIISNFVHLAITSITEVITTAYNQQNLLNDAIREYNDLVRDARRESHSGIFGSDEMGLATENMKILAEAQKNYENILNKFENERKLRAQKLGAGAWEWKGDSSISDILGTIADAQGWEMYRESGELNIDAIKYYYDAYANFLTRKQKKIVDELIASYDAQNDAAAQQAEYLKSLYGGVADTISESMVNAFIESGDAAIDMGEIVSGTAKTMVADLIKSLYILPILKQYENQALAIQNDAALTPDQKVDAQLSLLDNALTQITAQEDNINATLERFAEYLGEGEGTTEIGEGIKGMTEDTANLLASYLNAIRADVAYSKVLWQRMDANTQAIANALIGFSAPSLMEYQMKIEANTYNNMIATQEILSELRGLVTTESGATSLRVYREN